jgi:Fur family ferric uptake transcriptional regulator
LNLFFGRISLPASYKHRNRPGGGVISRNIEDLTNELHSSRYKLTPQRQSILQVLEDHGDSHLSAEEIYELLREESAEIGLATVYRTLDLFLELNILHKVDFDDGRSRYELAPAKCHRHHHLVCLTCGQVIEVKEDLLNQLEETIEQENGFLVLDHAVKFYGYCRQCRTGREK